MTFDLPHRSRLPGLCTTPPYPVVLGIFRHSRQEEFAIQPPLLKAYRQSRRYPMRSDCYAQEF
jgi:hypothetical protein